LRTRIRQRIAVVLATCVAGVVFPAAASHADSDPEVPIEPDDQSLVVRVDATETPSEDGQTTAYRVTRSVAVLKPGAVTPSSAIAACEDDPSFSVEVCGTVLYTSYKNGSTKYASMSQVGNQANREDRHARMLELEYGVHAIGPCDRGCTGSPDHRYDGHIGSPTSGHNYTWNVSWFGQYQRVSANPLDGQGLRQALKWKVGTRPDAPTYTVRNAIDVPS
jgi:hypothetical protein